MKYGLIILWVLLFHVSQGQTKTEEPRTYRNVCFYTINKVAFDDYLEIQNAVLQKDYHLVFPAIRKMKKSLNQFDIENYDRRFEFLYMVNYDDFDTQLDVTVNSTINALESYHKRIKDGSARYFDHRMFLNNYLAYKTEAFYPEFWFMSMERYFSEGFYDRILGDNKEGTKIFTYSEFYRPFEHFDEMLKQEENDIKRYLGIGEYGDDPSGIGDQPLIPYSFGVLDKVAASYILQNFELDASTQDLDTDRQMNIFKIWLRKVKTDEIWLIVRFDDIPFGIMEEE